MNVTGGQRKIQYETFHNLYTSFVPVRMTQQDERPRGIGKDNNEVHFGQTEYGPVAGSNSLRTKSNERHLITVMKL